MDIHGVTVSGGDVAVRAKKIPGYEGVYLARETVRALKRAFENPEARQACDAWKTEKYTGLIQQANPAMKPQFIKIDISTMTDEFSDSGKYIATTVVFFYRKTKYIFYKGKKKCWIERVRT